MANLRVDQAWGSAQIMGALHQVNSVYYTALGPAQGHPDDKTWFCHWCRHQAERSDDRTGRLLPGSGDDTQGALRYVFQTPNSNWGKVQGQDEGFGVVSDAIYGGNIPSRLAARRHSSVSPRPGTYQRGIRALLEPALAEIAYGGYAAVSHNSEKNAILCLTEAAGSTLSTGCCIRRLRQRLEHLVARLAHPVERHQGLLSGALT